MQAHDVVCGMTVGTEDAPSTEYKGTRYYFCCTGCQGAFEKSPEYHLENWREEHPDEEPTPSEAS